MSNQQQCQASVIFFSASLSHSVNKVILTANTAAVVSLRCAAARMFFWSLGSNHTTKTSHSVFQARIFTWQLSAVIFFTIQNTTQDPLYSSHTTQQNVNKRNGLELLTGKLWTAVHAASMHRSPDTTPQRMPVVTPHTFSPHFNGFVQRPALDVTNFTALKRSQTLFLLINSDSALWPQGNFNRFWM